MLRGEVAVLSAAVGIAALLVARARAKHTREALPPTFIISLRRRPAKRASALARAYAGGLQDVRVYDAVDGRDLSEAGLARAGVAIYGGWRLPGSRYKWFDRDLKWGEVRVTDAFVSREGTLQQRLTPASTDRRHLHVRTLDSDRPIPCAGGLCPLTRQRLGQARGVEAQPRGLLC